MPSFCQEKKCLDRNKMNMFRFGDGENAIFSNDSVPH
jgi:hypothetical protein